jgi:hypothetical protein
VAKPNFKALYWQWPTKTTKVSICHDKQEPSKLAPQRDSVMKQYMLEIVSKKHTNMSNVLRMSKGL